MSFLNPFAIGFACVAAGFVVGADYVVQSKNNDANPGEYAFTDYLESYGLRVGDVLTGIEKARLQAVPARDHLSQAPEGWVRTEWELTADEINATMAGLGIVERMAAKEEVSKSRKLAKDQAWVYSNGSETVRMAARFVDSGEMPETTVSGWLTGTFHPIFEPQYGPYAVIQGLPFLQVSDAEAEAPETHLLLEAHLGTQITLAVAADAKPETVAHILSQIDITGLNQMLDEPLMNVGIDAPAMTPEDEQLLAGFYAKSLNERTQVTAAMLREPLTADQVEADTVANLEAETEAAADAVQRIESQGGQAFGDNSNRLELSGGRSCAGGTGLLCD